MYGPRDKPTLLTLLLVAAVPSSGAASTRCEEYVLTASPTRWQAPLSKSISITLESLPLKVAIEKVAAAAQLRVSYSADLLPLDRKVCITYKGVAIGDALADLLKGVQVEPVVAGADHIVLAPRALRTAEADTREYQPLFPLSPLVATAQQASAVRHEKPSYSFATIDHATVAQHGSVAQALSATVPGVWAWQSPSGFTTLYSVRGASSFGASAPKIYIDGIEVANPLLATQLAPENIERIEVIRGPQGGALYGGDAISGVTNIVTRHESVAAGAPRLRLRSGLALSNSNYMAGAGVGQDHTVALQLGTRAKSGSINVGVGSVGEYMPGAFSRHVNADGSMRLALPRTLITGMARFVNQSTGNPFGLLGDSSFDATSVSMQQYTLGARAVIRQGGRVTHSVVLGIDGYNVSDLPSDSSMRLSQADSVLRAAGSEALRTTARISSAVRFDVGTKSIAKLTLSAEHSNLHQEGGYESAYYEPIEDASAPRPPVDPARSYSQVQHDYGAEKDGHRYEQSRSSNGLSAQLDATLFERATISAALRLEQDEINGIAGGTTRLPMLAASYLIGTQALNVRLRGSYGKAIRWPEMPNRVRGWSGGMQGSQTVLAPEQQSGLEAGLDLSIGSLIQFQVTGYDQVATGLIQCVAASSSVSGSGSGSGTRLELQNVGEIANRGWELQGSVRRGALSLTGTMALTDSRVQHVAYGYTGDLRAGDRMLAVPARTVSVSAAWLGNGWSSALTAYRAFDWINYDRVALAGKAENEVLGIQLRDYWRAYDGATRLRASLTRTLSRNLTVLLTGDNLLGTQIGEPDNLTVLPGRTVSFGVRAAF